MNSTVSFRGSVTAGIRCQISLALSVRVPNNQELSELSF